MNDGASEPVAKKARVGVKSMEKCSKAPVPQVAQKVLEEPAVAVLENLADFLNMEVDVSGSSTQCSGNHLLYEQGATVELVRCALADQNARLTSLHSEKMRVGQGMGIETGTGGR